MAGTEKVIQKKSQKFLQSCHVYCLIFVIVFHGMVAVLILNSDLKVNIRLSDSAKQIQNRKPAVCRFSYGLFAQCGTFFSRFTPDVNLRSPGNRNSQADLQSCKQMGKIRVDFLLLPDLSHLRFSVQKTEQQRLSLQESRKKREQFVFV